MNRSNTINKHLVKTVFFSQADVGCDAITTVQQTTDRKN